MHKKKLWSFSGTAVLFVILLCISRMTGPVDTTEKTSSPAATSTTTTHAITTDTTVTKHPDGALLVHFIDVGQGDSTFIELPNGETMLIDAGENNKGDIVCDYIKAQGKTKIDYLIGTHPHSDHIGGLDTVMTYFDIGTLYLPDKAHTTKTFTDVVNVATEKNVPTKKAEKGVLILQNEDLNISILSPVSRQYEELNDYSAVISLVYGDTSFLFMGDAEYTVENQLKSTISHHDVLKVGHHGSNSSSTANFLEKVRPAYAVISCGVNNDYGHPHEQVLKRFSRFESQMFRTDLDGSIVATSDGTNISFETKE